MSLLRALLVLALGCGLLVASPASAHDSGFGRAWRADGVLRPGCHAYRFHYRVRPHHHDWSLELFLRGPGDRGLGTVARDSDIHPRRGRGHFDVCSQSTRPGRYRIRGKLSIYESEGTPPFTTEPEEPVVKWIRPARFRLRRAG
jgi:hypothetical protein